MKKLLNILALFTIFFLPLNAYAEERLIEATGFYTMDSRLGETTASATARALEDAKRAAINKAGTYLESYTKVINLQVETDEIEAVAARLLKIQEEKSKVDVVDDNLLKFTVTIKAVVNDIDEAELKAIMSNRRSLSEMTANYNELKSKYDALNRQMEEYRKNFDGVNASGKAEIMRKTTQNSEKFQAVSWAQKGLNLYYSKNFSEALNAFDMAIRLDTKFAEAYNNRGVVKYAQNNYNGALTDYNTAINLRPNYIDAFNNRGNVYAKLGDYNSAARDFEASLSTGVKNAAIHNNLGSVYLAQKNFAAALNEYNIAVQIDPNFVESYYNRAIVYYAQQKFTDAKRDLETVLRLRPNDAEAVALYQKLL